MEKPASTNPLEQVLLSFLFLAVPVAVSFWEITGMLDQYSEFRWFLIYTVSILLVAGSFITRFKVLWPDPRGHRPLTWMLAGSFAFGLLASLMSFPGNLEIQLLEWLCFGVLLIWSYTLSQEDSSRALLVRSVRFANGIGILAVGGYLISQQLGYRWEYLATHPGQLASLFGNKNFAASYFAIASLIHLYGFRKDSPPLHRYGAIGILLLGVYGLASMKARGAALGFLAGVMLLGWRHLALSRKVKVGIASALLAVSIVSAVFLSYRGIEESGDTRRIRLTRWANTLALIAERPLGVGPGRYEFDYIPYSNRYQADPEITETNTSKSPHNLPLQIAAEYGVVTALLLSGVLGWILIRAWRLHPGPVAILVSMLVDGFFAFPFQIPYSFFVFAVFLGIALSGVLPARGFPEGMGFSAARGVMIVLMAWVNFLFASSVLAESYDMNDEHLMKRGCDHAPWRLKNCLSYATILGNQKRFKEGVEVSETVLRRQPNLFPGYFVLSELHRLSGNRAGYCEAIGRFDQVFGGRSSLHQEWLANCRN
jgi:O-antigen ligase